MPRTAHPDREIPFLDQILAFEEGAPAIEQKLELVRTIRATMPDGGRQLDHLLLDHLGRARVGLRAAEAAHQELREMLERLGSPPWHTALFLRPIETAGGPRAMVLHAGARRVVDTTEEVDVCTLVPGEEVFLATEANVVTGRAPYGMPPYGETAHFERALDDGRCVLLWRDEEIVVDAAGPLDVAALAAGDRVRFDRTAWMALEKVDGGAGRRFLLAEVPMVGRGAVGGQTAALESVLSALTATLVAPETAALYGLAGRCSILMVGPPGCGKTLIARVAAAEVVRLGGRRCRFGVVKPAEWENSYVGATQEAIRHCFRALREAAADGYAVLFLDEIESIGRIRGAVANHHSDKFLAAFLAELDGFTDRSRVAIVAATNRKDLVDPALLERLSDVEVAVGRPDLHGAREIFGIHLPAALPCADVGHEELVDVAVSRLYGPNADNDVATLRFRDGKTRTVAARQLASGRMIEQICRAARRIAFEREVRGGERGMRVADVEDAIAAAIERLATVLSPRNARDHLADLPHDADVVSVEPVVRRVTRPHRYRSAA